MTTELTFENINGVNTCNISGYSNGDVLQIQTQSKAPVVVSANIPEMPPAVIGIFENPYGNSVIFSLDIPDGLEITIETQTPIISAVWKQ